MINLIKCNFCLATVSAFNSRVRPSVVWRVPSQNGTPQSGTYPKVADPYSQNGSNSGPANGARTLPLPKSNISSSPSISSRVSVNSTYLQPCLTVIIPSILPNFPEHHNMFRNFDTIFLVLEKFSTVLHSSNCYFLKRVRSPLFEKNFIIYLLL